MPRASRLNLPPMDLGGETIEQRLARIRRERGFTQIELAERIGILQTLVTDYECDRLRLSAEMAIRFAVALEVGMDDLFRPEKEKRRRTAKPSRRVLRRLELIESLPSHQQQAVLRSIDMMLRGLRNAS